MKFNKLLFSRNPRYSYKNSGLSEFWKKMFLNIKTNYILQLHIKTPQLSLTLKLVNSVIPELFEAQKVANLSEKLNLILQKADINHMGLGFKALFSY